MDKSDPRLKEVAETLARAVREAAKEREAIADAIEPFSVPTVAVDWEKVSAAHREALARWEAECREAELPPSVPPPDKAKLARLRRTLLEHWERVTGGRRSHLYAWRSNGVDRPLISKAQFYAWLHGELSPASKPARRLEAYLREQVNNTQMSMDRNFPSP